MAHRILVCDDEPFILKALTFIVRKEGHTVLEARNGEEALEKVRAERPAVVFLDVMMPKKNGYEVLAEIRKDAAVASTYVILLTAKGQDSDRERGLTLGANEFMTKPFSPAFILARLREILNGPGAPGGLPPTTGTFQAMTLPPPPDPPPGPGSPPPASGS